MGCHLVGVFVSESASTFQIRFSSKVEPPEVIWVLISQLFPANSKKLPTKRKYVIFPTINFSGVKLADNFTEGNVFLTPWFSSNKRSSWVWRKYQQRICIMIRSSRGNIGIPSLKLAVRPWKFPMVGRWSFPFGIGTHHSKHHPFPSWATRSRLFVGGSLGERWGWIPFQTCCRLKQQRNDWLRLKLLVRKFTTVQTLFGEFSSNSPTVFQGNSPLSSRWLVFRGSAIYDLRASWSSYRVESLSYLLVLG